MLGGFFCLSVYIIYIEYKNTFLNKNLFFLLILTLTLHIFLA